MGELLHEKCPAFGCSYGGTDAQLADHKEKMDAHHLHERQISSDPKPFCIGCIKVPEELYECVTLAEEEGVTPDEIAKQDGTYNHRNGHFMCNKCYIAAGSPSGPKGWKAP